jgi:sigma-B regulation protein RsbU (phosphoserine phosphatase)
VMPDVDVHDDDLLLADGDALVFYTDGVTERRDGAVMFGEESLLATLAAHAGGDADALAAELAQSVRAFAADTARDDMAVLVVRAVPVRAEARVAQPA